ncbi:MAG TPA: GMC family oxidoreductase [Polyangia bacterium]|nr:GMC family oxidoreductase [Polyangia bacterium]
MSPRCDVCVIGSGVAGGVVAEEVLAAGRRDVLMLEAGRPALMRDHRTWLDAWMGEPRDPFAAHTYAPAEYVSTGDPRLELRGGLLRARGGSTLHWEGMCFRLKPEDFKLHSSVSLGADWPIDYAALEPYYALAEQTLQVAGDASDPGHPPRSGPFPLPPFPAQAADERFIDAMAALGHSTQYCCIARNSRPIHGMAQCQQTGTCQYCPIGGRFTGDQLIDRLMERPGFRLLTGVSALRLIFTSKKRAAAVEILDQSTGRIDRVEAETFVVCAGAVESPKLLLASACPEWPRGAANDRGRVGRALASHAVQTGTATDRAPNRERVSHELAFVTTVSRAFDTAEHQRQGKFLLWPLGTRAPLDFMLLAGEDAAQIDRELAAPRLHGLTFQLEPIAQDSNYVTLESGQDALGLPRTRVHHAQDDTVRAGAAAARKSCERIFAEIGCGDVTWTPLDVSSHFLGTCRMSDDPGGGVVSRELQLHGVDNVYLCGSAVFPSVGAANPTLTIVALAHRLGRLLRERHA